jgi:hypothetical protein
MMRLHPLPRLSSTVSRLLSVAAIAALAATAGCAGFRDMHREQAARASAEQRWQHLIRQDFDAAYAMHSAGWRGLNPLPEWRQRFGKTVQWLAAETTGSSCEDHPPVRCVVKVRVRTQLVGLPVKDVPRDSEVEEVWIWQDGRWWMVPGQ